MDHSRAVRTGLLDEWSGETRVKSAIDEPSSRSQNASNLGCDLRKVFGIGMSEGGHRRVKRGIAERHGCCVTDDQVDGRADPLTRHPKLVLGFVDAGERPACSQQGRKVRTCATPDIDAPAGTDTQGIDDGFRRGLRERHEILLVPIRDPVVASSSHGLPNAEQPLWLEQV